MDIYGFGKNTLIDYPGKVASIVFTGGCNFNCPFCYSKELVHKETPKIDEEEIFSFLKERKEYIDALVICGGEPTVNKDLKDFVIRVKEMGYLVKLDTNGTNPDVVKDLIDNKLIDYVAMDIKGPKEKYNLLAGANIKLENIERTINILKESNIGYQFRTTVVPNILKKEDFIKIADWIGSKETHYALQGFSTEKELMDTEYNKLIPYTTKYLNEIKDEIKDKFQKIDIKT